MKDKEWLHWYGTNRQFITNNIILATKPTDYARIAIFGAGGFVGKNLLKYLSDNTQYSVVPYLRSDCDIMDKAALQKKLDHIQPDVVINLAAFVGGIGLNKDNSADMIYRNLIMSANMVDACFTAGVRKLVFLGSVCSYELIPPEIPFIEDHLWSGLPEYTNRSYGIAKKTIGIMLDAYKQQFNFSSAYLIPTNMYGPYDNFDLQTSHVIPAMIRKFIEAKESSNIVIHWGNGTATRDFLYVDDCCSAICSAIEHIDYPVPINIGSGYECGMCELSDLISDIVKFSGSVDFDRSKPNGQPRRCLDINRAKTLLSFEPEIDLKTGIERTVKWYLENRNK